MGEDVMSSDAPENTGWADPAPRPAIVVGDALLARLGPPPGFAATGLDAWIAALGPRATVSEAPLGLLLAPADRDRLKAAPEAAELAAALELPVVDLAPDAAPEALAAAAVGLVAESLARHRAAAAEERAAAAALRDQHREMQDRFAQVEEFFYHSLAPKFIRTEEFPPAEASLRLAAGAGPLVQRLPFSTRSLAGLDLYLAEAGEGGGGTLTLRLGREVGPDFADPIPLSLAGMTPGWIRFLLPRVLSGAPEDVIARVAYEGPGAVALGLSHPCPVAEYRVAAPDGPREEALAVRGYRGLPGAPLPPPHLPRHAPPPDGTSRLISAGDLKPLRKLPVQHKWEAQGGYPDFTAVEYWTGENAVLVHPSTEGPVCGIVRNVAASALRQLRASIHVGHRGAGHVWFAIGAAPAGRVHRLHQALRWLGGWTGLDAGQFGTAFALPARPIAGPFDLLLATTMEGRPHNRNAWALFRDIETVNGPPES